MAAGKFGVFILLSICISISSGSSASEKKRIQENQIPFSSSASLTQFDTIPIINPMNPTPIVIPYPPPAPISTDPFVNPMNPTPIVIPYSPPAPTSTDPFVNPMTPTAATPTTIPVSSTGSWCIASSIASPTALQVALDYACGYGGADCSAVQPGGGCSEPNTVRDHASYAFNDYYQKNPLPTSCVFGGTAQLSTADPSHDNCRYASSRTIPSTTTTSPAIPSPIFPTTPTISTPTTDSSVFGSEPTGSPSSADTILPFLPIVFTVAGFVGTVIAANNF